MVLVSAGARAQDPMQVPGAAPQTVQEGGASGDVNLLNGALSLSVPVGPVFQVNEALSYQLRLNYSSANRRWVTRQVGGGPKDFIRGRSPLGWGWVMHFGRIAPDPNKNLAHFPNAKGYQSEDGVWHSLRLYPNDPGRCGTAHPTCYVSEDTTYIRAVEGAGGVPWRVWTPDGVERLLEHRIDPGWACDHGGELAGCDAQDDFEGWYTTQILAPTGPGRVTIAWDPNHEHCMLSIGDSVRAAPTIVFQNQQVNGQFGSVGGITKIATVANGEGHSTWRFDNYDDETNPSEPPEEKNWIPVPVNPCGSPNQSGGPAVNLLLGISVDRSTGGELIRTAIGYDHGHGAPVQVDLPDGLARAEYTWQCIPYGTYRVACTPPGCPCEVDDQYVHGVIEKKVRRGSNALCTESGVDCWNYERERFSTDYQPALHPCGIPALSTCIPTATNPNRVTVTLPTTPGPTGEGVRHQRIHYFSSGCNERSTALPPRRNGLELRVDHIFVAGVPGTRVARSTIRTWELDNEVGGPNPRVSIERTEYEHLEAACGSGPFPTTFTEVVRSVWDDAGHFETNLERTNEGTLGPWTISRSTLLDYEVMPADRNEWFLGRLNWRKVFDGVGGTPVLEHSYEWDQFGRLHREFREGGSPLHLDVTRHVGWGGDGHQKVCETWSGGDTEIPAPLTDLSGRVLCDQLEGCGLAMERTHAYAVEYAYSEGAVSSRQHRGAPWKLFDVDRSPISGAVTIERDPMSRYSRELNYDELGRVKEVRYLDGTSEDEADLTLAWPAATEMTWSRDGAEDDLAGEVRYDAYGRRTLVRVVDPDDPAKRLLRRSETDGNGNALCEGDWERHPEATVPETCASSGIQYWGYDVLGRPSSAQRDGAAIATYSYCGESTNETRSVWTATGDTVVTVGYEKDGFGRLRRVTDQSPAGPRSTTYGYDVLDRLTSVVIQVGPVTQTRTFSYDWHGNLRQAVDPESGTTDYPEYDARGHLVTSIDARPVTRTRTWDCAERMTREQTSGDGCVDPIFRSWTYDGSHAGSLVESRSRNCLSSAHEVKYNYLWDGRMGRLSSLETTVLGKVFSSGITYTDLGLLDQLSYPTSAQDREPTRHGLLLEHDYVNGFLDVLHDPSAGHARQYAYDIERSPSGRVQLAYHPNLASPGAPIYHEREQDAHGRVSFLRGGLDGSTAEYASGLFAYDGSDNPKAIGPNTFVYHKDGGLDYANLPDVTGTIDYAHDGFGNLTHRTSLEPFTVSVDDRTNRIIGYTYQNNGNLQTDAVRNSFWDGFDRLYQIWGPSGQVNLFDADGNRIESSTSAGCRDGRLFSIRGADGSVLSDYWSDSGSCIDHVVWLRDHLYLDGERVATRANATLATPASCTRKCCSSPAVCSVIGVVAEPDFNACRSDGVHVYRRAQSGAYDFENPLEAVPIHGTCLGPANWSTPLTEASCFVVCAIHKSGERVCGTESCFTTDPEPCNTVCSLNLCPPPVDPPLATRVSYELRDHLGTPRVTIGDDGVVRGRLRLGPFGEVIDEAECDQRMQFTGHERDEATGLDYMRARFYDRGIARFMSPDPLRGVAANPKSWNSYSYVQNNPLRRTDPLGLAGSETSDGPTDAGKDNSCARKPNGKDCQKAPVWRRWLEKWQRLHGRVGDWVRSKQSSTATPTGVTAEPELAVVFPAYETRAMSVAGDLADKGTEAAQGAAEGVLLGALVGVAAGWGDIHGGLATADEALGMAQMWLGSGYREIAPGVYRSSDNLRQFRMVARNLGTDAPHGGPHVNFESIATNGRTILESAHLYILDP